MNGKGALDKLALVGALALLPVAATADAYSENVMLHGAVVTADRVSGFRGTTFTVDADTPDHALYSISSAERRDQPCVIIIGTEDVNRAERKGGDMKDLCGDSAYSSRTMRAHYSDNVYSGARVFATGLRVCMNGRGTRVKGFQLTGKQIVEGGQLADLETVNGSRPRLESGGGVDVDLHLHDKSDWQRHDTHPADYRNNCEDWSRWSECPYPNMVATGIVAHFEAGNKPRALTGLQVRCRYVGRQYAPS